MAAHGPISRPLLSKRCLDHRHVVRSGTDIERQEGSFLPFRRNLVMVEVILNAETSRRQRLAHKAHIAGALGCAAESVNEFLPGPAVNRFALAIDPAWMSNDDAKPRAGV